MVSWSASAKTLMELADPQSAHDSALVRAAAGAHERADSDWVYVCPPAWGVTPREFAAACFYSEQEGVSWTDWVGGGSLLGTLGVFGFVEPSTAVAAATLAVVGPAALAMPLSTTARRRIARNRVSRWRSSGLDKVIEVARDEFNPDSLFLDDLDTADALKPGSDDAKRRSVLKRLWLSAGGDPTVADTLPDKGWVSKKPEKLWANRIIEQMSQTVYEDAAKQHNACGDNTDDCNSSDSCACAYCESDWQNEVEHQPTPAAAAIAAPPAPKPTTMAGRWIDALARFEIVESEWEAIVTDPMAALDHSALLDVSLPRTATFIETFGKAKDLQARHAAHSPADGPEDRADVVEFEDAVRAAQSAWTEAKRWADHVGITWLPEAEQETARTARSLLALALDERTPIAEAVSAAEKAARLLKSIQSVVLPEPAMRQIETVARLAIG